MNIVQPTRVTRSYTQRLVAAPSVVFPLLCPVREADWIEGWDPISVVTGSGAAEPDCVFVTPPGDHVLRVVHEGRGRLDRESQPVIPRAGRLP